MSNNVSKFWKNFKNAQQQFEGLGKDYARHIQNTAIKKWKSNCLKLIAIHLI